MKNINVLPALIAGSHFGTARDENRFRSRCVKSALAALSIAATLAATKATAVNILTNPGFESGGSAWTISTPQGNGGNVFESQAPNHGGANVYKNWGCWCNPTNDQAVIQDKQAGPGNAYTASGFVRSGNNGDAIGGDNQAWLEVAFLDAGGNALELYQSQHLDNTASTTSWTQCDITNKVDLVTGAVIGNAASLVAPAGTKTVRFRAVYQQRNGGGGSAQFDDMTLDQTGGNIPPVISSLTPNGAAIFNPASAGVTFIASSLTTNISTSGIKLILNGLDVSGGLGFTGPANNRSVTYSGLADDRLYSAVVNVTDEAGYVSSASVTFDTFKASNFTWEAEDYNFNGGQFLNNPTPTSTNFANSYFGQLGTAGVDWYESGGWGGNLTYRESGSGPGVERSLDFLRQKYVDAAAGGDTNVVDYDVGWVSGLDGDWMNYTRTIAAGSYNIYGRLAGGGGINKCRLVQVTASATNELGVMTITGTGYQSWKWAPVADAGGNLVTVTFATTTNVTFRASADGLNMTFFMLAPARTDLPLINNLYPTGTRPFESGNTLSFNASSSVATIPTGNIHVTLNGNNVDALLTIGSNTTNRTVSLPYLASNAQYTATISVTDSAGTTTTRELSFDTFSEANYSFEAEDWDFDTGQFIASPVLSTTPGANNYYMHSPAGVENVDLFPSNIGGQHYDYRLESAGTEVASDYVRQAYVTAQGSDAGVRDYDVGWWVAGQWFNYTRPFPAGNYRIYGRFAGPATYTVQLERVSGGATNTLGNFSGASIGWQTWTWTPLTSSGQFVTVAGGSTQTLRITSTTGGANVNFYMLAPAKNAVALAAGSTGGQHTVSIPTQAGATYTLYYKNAITDADWTYLTIVAGDGTTKTYTDTTATGSQRFYRAVIQ